MYCKNCGTRVQEGGMFCVTCGEQQCSYPARKNEKSRLIYILLAVFLGIFGVHNFYARRIGPAIAQLLITVLLWWLIFTFVAVWVWIIVEICTVEKDGDGQAFN